MLAPAPPDQAALTALMDFIQARVLAPSKLFASEAEQNRVFFEGLRRDQRAWTAPRPCAFMGCGNLSIPLSHTLQKAGPLARIAEGGEVLTPRHRDGVFGMSREGLRQASTFAGFCQAHEAMFASFERNKTLADQTIGLQVFRTLCREIVRKRHEVETLEASTHATWARLEAAVASKARSLGLTFSRLELPGTVFDLMKTTLADRRESLARLEALYHPAFAALTGGEPLGGFAYRIPFELPVALSGLAGFGFDGDFVDCLLGVIPEVDETVVFVMGEPAHRSAFETYAPRCQTLLSLLDHIEAWMINGTDHWFLRPSIWRAIPKARQDALLERHLETKDDIRSPAPWSIFDDLRREALTSAPAPSSKAERAFLARQRRKLESP